MADRAGAPPTPAVNLQDLSLGLRRKSLSCFLEIKMSCVISWEFPSLPPQGKGGVPVACVILSITT